MEQQLQLRALMQVISQAIREACKSNAAEVVHCSDDEAGRGAVVRPSMMQQPTCWASVE